MPNTQAKIKKLLSKLPGTPGVYRFVGKNKELLYIGKATSLKSRVRSYFALDIGEKRSEWIKKMVEQAVSIKFEKTDSVLEALILEAELIKKHQPPYNTADKDQKSWNYVVITKDPPASQARALRAGDFPRVLIMREREISPLAPLTLRGEPNQPQIKEKFGPFTNSTQLKEALKIIRKIFPFRDTCKVGGLVPRSSSKARSEVGCFNYQIKLCPGTCTGAISKQEYAKTIRNIILFFKGKKKVLIKTLEKEMRILAKDREFEKAAAIKSKIFALQHIHDIALIKKDSSLLSSLPKWTGIYNLKSFRIEAYDIAHLSRTNMVGVMTVVLSGEVKKNDYRMFKIRGQKNVGDTQALREVLERRFGHTEWPFPDLIVVDGGVAQLNAAEKLLKDLKMERWKDIRIVAVVKDKNHKPKEILGMEKWKKEKMERLKPLILLANSESHRFALSFHRKLRSRLPR